MAEFYHSVTLNEEKCVGCTNCIKRCPTEAIRVRGGKAVIASERCIDCGECIRICPHHAKRARHSHLSQLSDFTYTIALPAPSLYGQFNNLDDIDYVLTGLKEMGFDDVFEVSRAAELVSEATRKLMDAGALKRPVPPALPWCGLSGCASPICATTCCPSSLPWRQPPPWPSGTP